LPAEGHAGATLWAITRRGEETIAEYKASLADDGQLT
jgi:hypothetical protein